MTTDAELVADFERREAERTARFDAQYAGRISEATHGPLEPGALYVGRVEVHAKFIHPAERRRT